MDIDKAIYHLKQAEKELSEYIHESNSENTYDHQSYLIAMSNVFDFVHSIKPLKYTNSVVRDDY